MSMLRTPLGYCSALESDLMTSSSFIKLSDARALNAIMVTGDYTYLQVADGVHASEIKVTRAAAGYKVEFVDQPRSYQCGAVVRFTHSSTVISDLIDISVRDAVGTVLRSISSTNEEQLGVSVDNGVVTLNPATAEEEASLCASTVGTEYDYVIACKDGEIIRVALSTGETGGLLGIAGSEAIEVGTGVTPTVGLKEIFAANQDACGLVFDKYGRFIRLDECPGGTSIFADGVDVPAGSFIPQFTVINGQIIAMEAADVASGENAISADGALDTVVTSDGVIIRHNEVFANTENVERYGLIFDKYGHYTESEDPDNPYQRYTKVPWMARASFDIWGGEANAFDEISTDNITSINEGIRGNDFVNYEFEFENPSPDLEYYVQITGAGIRPGKIEKTLDGFTCILYGYGNDIVGEANKQTVDVVVTGTLQGPTVTTNTSYVPESPDPE